MKPTPPKYSSRPSLIMASVAGPSSPYPIPLNHLVRTRGGPGPVSKTFKGQTRNTQAKEVEEARERKEETNRKIASQKAISIILRREAAKAVIEKKKGNPKKLLPTTVLEALHERITALRWESALKVFELLREQLWYKPNSGIYIKLIVMLGKCKQPEKAHILFQAMTDEGCVVDREAYTALMSAYSRSGLFDEAFSILEQMKKILNCQPDVYTYSILIKSCLQVHDFGKVQSLLADMEMQGVNPNTITYNTLIDAYGKAKKFSEMESVLVRMLRQRECQPDVWTMNSTLRAFGGSGQIEMMEKCYEKFQLAGITPTIQTFNILLDSYGKTGNYKKMSAVMHYMQAYHFSWTLVTYNIVIDAFGRAGDLKQMEYLFRLMQSEKVKPNCVTLCSLVRAYGRAGRAEKIRAALRFVENSDVMLDTVFFNCLVDAYGMMGCFAEMKGSVEMMKRKGCVPDKVTYRTMIKAYELGRMKGHAKEVRKELACL
ncbi:pentatricopeptide repeat-containing protein [Striga asiatica]|uniref:Pentatricopeptide repeat-containing protein n=1 Tax=Striga asiatica TaxID=4170 RepID=A0A5A7PJT5_STRAF|nr:pentatricopeptide repeat-containing protein [Striga asiatica]